MVQIPIIDTRDYASKIESNPVLVLCGVHALECLTVGIFRGSVLSRELGHWLLLEIGHDKSPYHAVLVLTIGLSKRGRS